MVAEGEFVRKNQLIAVFDTYKSRIDLQAFKKVKKNLLSSRENSKRLYELQKKTIASEIKLIDAKLKTQSQILSSLASLMEIGGFQRIQYLGQKDKLLILMQEKDSIIQSLTQINLSEERDKLDSENQIQQISSKIAQTEFFIENSEVKANQDGLIFNSKLQIEGTYMSGEDLVTIVPQQGMYASVLVADKDVGFVSSGQSVSVRVDAYPFSTYGDLKGKIKLISAYSISPSETERAGYYNFPVDIALNSNKLTFKDVKIPLMSGMAVTANIKLREKRLITIVTDLFSDQMDSIKSIR